MRTLDEALQARREEKERLAEQQAKLLEEEKTARELREQEAANLAAGYLATEYDVEWPDSFDFVARELDSESSGLFVLRILVGIHINAKVELYPHCLKVEKGMVQFIPDDDFTSYIWHATNKGSLRQHFENLLDAVEHAMS